MVHAERMSFTNPVFLWLTPLSVIVAWWWSRRPRAALQFSDVSLFASGRGRRAWRAVWGGAALRGLACLALVLACAGPREPDLKTRLPASGIAIEMIVDVSGSMGDQDFVWSPGVPLISRLEAARRAFKLFVEGGESPDGTTFEPRPSDAIGLVELAAVPESLCPLTLNHSVLLQNVKDLKPKVDVNAGTNIGDAIAEAVIRLDQTSGNKRKVIILLSDGQHIQSKDGPEAMHKPREAAQLAANLGYPIYAIDCGGILPVTAAPDAIAEREAGKETMQAVAAITNGRSFVASNGAEFLEAYKEISRLEKSTVESFQYRRFFEYYPWCAAAAIGLLFTAHALERTRWRVLP
jgi:Ca-activated chloride channel family protein